MKYLGLGLYSMFLILNVGYSQTAIDYKLTSATHFYTSPTLNVNWAVGETFSESLDNNSISISPGISERNLILVITDVRSDIEDFPN